MKKMWNFLILIYDIREKETLGGSNLSILRWIPGMNSCFDYSRNSLFFTIHFSDLLISRLSRTIENHDSLSTSASSALSSSEFVHLSLFPHS